MKIRDLPDLEKPRERLCKYGTRYLSNEELIAILLRTGDKGVNVKELSNNVLVKLKSISDIGLSEDETEAINYMRRNGKNLSQIIDYFAQERLNAYLNEHPEDVHQKKYTIDDYNDEELYLADLQAKYPNFTDEELFSKLDSAKENEELFKKEVEALRAEYKEDEDNYNKQLEQKEQEDYQRLQDNLQRAASEFNEVLLDPDDPESDSLQIEDSDRQQIMQYLLEQDKDGKSRFVRDIEDPKSLVQLAWLRLQGNNAITDTTRY